MKPSRDFWLGLTAASICLSFMDDAVVCGFVGSLPSTQQQTFNRQSTNLYETTSDGEDINSGSTATATNDGAVGESFVVKRDLLQLAASYDRGYGATQRARNQVDALISKLENMNPEQNAIRGIDGNSSSSSSSSAEKNDDNSDNGVVSPLTGSWRMVWTTAADVLTLSANPLVTVGAIYQVFDPPRVTNVIDFLPPFQTLVGSQLGSLIRAKVTTRAYRGKKDTQQNSNRIGLDFEKVALEPVELLGNDVGFLPPLGFDLPRAPFEGYFDVTYLDEELLIIRQNAPGGLFVLAKVDNFDP